ncbi:MAG: hypothetical protein A3B47_02755 [Candidatus Levybacteria bacterium RIFCSPLOWO2_01_FULL_39_24]|nr:MAG: hypothetical protein A2800_02045 [Candidatus Levybacteria bacterium RIFCSPHIGHO2_01_FULL_40_16]OGH28820.1 MAG: hypothetical protein A3E12_03970 [Candidatus Levybacteria bacterium RIFCSPHIGHO2_12_FULL_39_9]OGH46541.1 MAG: hypothetical protein A3B47_02755 [Candidatus Levybacteria bacterium RIFCSPLOWO2_01_FULL_39_24]
MRRGFTLIELLIVIAVIGILAVAIISIINPLTQFQKANDSRRKSDLAQIQRAFETYYQDYGKFPDSSGYIIAGIGWGLSWMPYMGTLPKDPASPSRNYVYYSSSDGQTYYLYASLERGGNDPQACNLGNACTSLGTNGIPTNACASGSIICNYGVSSPNVSP